MNERDLKKALPNEELSRTEGTFERPKVDSRLTAEEAINHPNCPPEIKERLEVVTVKYLSFDNLIHEGQIVVDTDLAQDVKELFDFIFTLPEEHRFPIATVVPIVKFNWDDEASMSVNNSSAFNYRKIEGQDKISLHSYGFAIDLNPQLNPVIIDGKVTQPVNGSYNTEVVGTLYEGHPIVEFMKARGWEWGGDWQSKKDYQHFQKKVY